MSSDRTFKYEITVTDDNGTVRTREHTFFRPSNVNRFDSEPFIALLTERVLSKSKYDAEQMDLNDEQDMELIRSDYEEHNTRAFAYSGAK